MFTIKKQNCTYHFVNYGENIDCDNIITWLETYNPIYDKLPKILLSKNYTGMIKLFVNDALHLEIKIYEGSFLRIKNFTDDLVRYIEDSYFPLEIRENNKINKVNVQYIYDNYNVVYKQNDNIIQKSVLNCIKTVLQYIFILLHSWITLLPVGP